jgi:hypothetical protein
MYMSIQLNRFWVYVHTSYHNCSWSTCSIYVYVCTTPSPKVTKVVTVTLKSYGTLWSDINSIIPILDLPLHMYNHYCNQISLQLVTYCTEW